MKLKHQQGTTFIELITALAIIGVVVIGFWRLTVIALRSQQQLKFNAAALHLASIYLDAAQSASQLAQLAAEILPDGQFIKASGSSGLDGLKVVWQGGQVQF